MWAVFICAGASTMHAEKTNTKCNWAPVSASYFFFISLPLFQLSQSGASLDNRVPTPASAASADLHSQHFGADLPTQEVKTEAHHDQHEFEAAGGKTEPKMEVGWSYVLKYVYNLLTCFVLLIHGASSHWYFLGTMEQCLHPLVGYALQIMKLKDKHSPFQ